MELDENITEEIFCLKYELHAISEVLIHNQAERWVYRYMYPQVEREHMDRYNFVKEFVKEKRVLDVAGGSGYGSFLLASVNDVKEVYSVELDENAVRYANYRYPHPKLKRLIANAESFTNPEYYDVIVSFETIEHLNEPEKFIESVIKSLSKDGIFIVSTPIVKQTSKSVNNPYHSIEWSLNDFKSFLGKKFVIKDINIQNLYYVEKGFTSLIKRLRDKVFNRNVNNGKRKDIIKLSDEINIDFIEGGYQIYVCKPR
jgi:2-polyprenyl-3-methyl-5-hydroxy-6-metoxy-1,4-benzoquinol methylase